MSRSASIVALVYMPAAVSVAPSQGAQVVALPTPERDRPADAELVARAGRGDEWAHEAIYRRYVRLIAGIAQRLLRDPAEVDDVIQETFLIAFEQLPRLAAPSALRGWLARIAIAFEGCPVPCTRTPGCSSCALEQCECLPGGTWSCKERCVAPGSVRACKTTPQGIELRP